MRSRVAFLALSLLALSRFARAEPPSAPPAKAAAPTPPPPDPLVRAALVTPAFADQAVRAALRAARFPEEHEHLASMASRARSAAALPELWLRAARSTDDSLRLSPTSADPASYSLLGGAGLLLEARLVWHLDRLVFDRDEIQVEHLRGNVGDAAVKLTRRVLELLFAWQRAALRATDPKLSPEDNQNASLSRAEAEVVLDILTDGWFGERIPRVPPSGS
jgi:hypothetical protein